MLALVLFVAGCGLQTPSLMSPFHDKDDAKIAVNHVVNRVKCELIQGIFKVISDDKELAKINNWPRKLKWLEDWSAQITLTIIVEENSTLTANVVYSDPLSTVIETFSNGTSVPQTRAVTVSAGGSLSSTATRTEKLDFFVVFRDFLEYPNPNTNLLKRCEDHRTSQLASDLKLGEWIEVATFPVSTRSSEAPLDYLLPMSVIQHEVNFLIRSQGNVTPAWKLVPVSINQGNFNFLQTHRAKTDKVLITMGATAAKDASKRPAKPAPSQALVNSHLATEIGSAVSSALKQNQ
ncbi:MAG: hypothetical protein AB7F09_10910 [Parvibaculaceae bacterium]